MKKHEQWEISVQQKWDKEKWWNAIIWYPSAKSGQRYVKTEEEAHKVLDHAYKIWNGEKSYDADGKRYTTQQAGLIGISVEHTKQSDDDHRIVKHRIRKRIVTEWETIEEE